MMGRFLLAVCLILGSVANADVNFHCTPENADVYPKEMCYVPACTTAIRNHIKEEFKAAFEYMHLGAYFAQSSVGRPGMTKFMLDSASEERQHGIQMLDYLNKRGVHPFTKEEIFAFGPKTLHEREKTKSMSVLTALKKALKMEMRVTNKIHRVIKDCDSDYHAADVFTNPILEEQHDGIRMLQGAIRDFENQVYGLGNGAEAFVEFLFDQKFLKGEL